MALLTIFLFGKRSMVEETSSRYLAVIILVAFVVGLNLFFWLAVFVLWINLSEECKTGVSAIGRKQKDCTMMFDCISLLVRSKEASATCPPPSLSYPDSWSATCQPPSWSYKDPCVWSSHTEVIPIHRDNPCFYVLISRIHLPSIRWS